MENRLKGFENTWCHVPGYLPDIMPTILNVTGATYPSTFHNGNKIHPLVGTDLMPAIKGKFLPFMNICIGNIRVIELSVGKLESGMGSGRKSLGII